MSTTMTCYCGAVQLAFSIEGDDLVNAFTCHCTDCHKLTASAFSTNFIIYDKSLKYVRGEDKIKTFEMTKTVATGNTMTNYFCGDCGCLMTRVSSGWPGFVNMRAGQLDDLTLLDTKLKPQFESFTKDRVSWLHGAKDTVQYRGNFLGGDKEVDTTQ